MEQRGKTSREKRGGRPHLVLPPGQEIMQARTLGPVMDGGFQPMIGDHCRPHEPHASLRAGQAALAEPTLDAPPVVALPRLEHHRVRHQLKRDGAEELGRDFRPFCFLSLCCLPRLSPFPSSPFPMPSSPSCPPPLTLALVPRPVSPCRRLMHVLEEGVAIKRFGAGRAPLLGVGQGDKGG